MKIIYKSKDSAEAHIVSGMLDANGIKAYVGGHYLQGGVGELAAMDFANVQVADEDVSSARLIIAEYDSVPIDAEKKADAYGITTRENRDKIGVRAQLLLILSASNIRKNYALAKPGSESNCY